MSWLQAIRSVLRSVFYSDLWSSKGQGCFLHSGMTVSLPPSRWVCLISDKLSIISNMLISSSNKLSILCNKLSIISNKLSILVHTILVQAILVQRYSCAPNILYYIKYSNNMQLILR